MNGSGFELKVETAVLKNTASEVRGLARTLQSDFDELQTLVSRTTSYWVGAAGDQYRREFAEEKQETSEILRLIGQYPTDLLNMAGIYDSTEDDIEARNQGLRTDFIKFG